MNCSDMIWTEELIRLFVAGTGKPQHDFGFAGATPENTWLDTQSRPSNKVGSPFGLNNGRLVTLWVGNELLAAYQIKIYYHYGDEVGLTLLKTLNVPNTSRTKVFTLSDIGTVSVPNGCQIAARIGTITGTPTPRNTGCIATILGTT